MWIVMKLEKSVSMVWLIEIFLGDVVYDIIVISLLKL